MFNYLVLLEGWEVWEVWIWTGCLFTNIVTLLAVWEQLEVLEVLRWNAYIFTYILNLFSRIRRVRSVSNSDVEDMQFLRKFSFIKLLLWVELEVWEVWILTGYRFTNIVNLISSMRIVRIIWSLDMETLHSHIYYESL